LARHKVSIASVIQPEAPDDHDGASVPLVIMTHTVATGSFQAAFAEIDRLSSVCSPGAYFPVAD
jgi:hypothetical protein